MSFEKYKTIYFLKLFLINFQKYNKYNIGFYSILNKS